MRGPYSAPKRTHVIKARLDDEEYESFMKRCEVYKMTQSSMIRTSLEKLSIYPIIKFSSVNKDEKMQRSCGFLLNDSDRVIRFDLRPGFPGFRA